MSSCGIPGRPPSSGSCGYGAFKEASAELSKPLAAVYRAVEALVTDAQRASLQRLDAERAEVARVRAENGRLRAQLGRLRDRPLSWTAPPAHHPAGSEITFVEACPEAGAAADVGADAGGDLGGCRSPSGFTVVPEGLVRPCSKQSRLGDELRGERDKQRHKAAWTLEVEDASEPLGRPPVLEDHHSDWPTSSIRIPRPSSSARSGLRSTGMAAKRGADSLASDTLTTSVRTRKSRLSGIVALGERAVFKPGAAQRRVFTDVDQMKDKVRSVLMKPDYNVAKLYHKTGICQAISTHRWFDAVSLAVVIFNAVWIGVDTDLNSELVLVDAKPHFQVMEHLFCAYFQFDWWVRFLAFRSKCEGMRDSTFALDTVLLVVMTFETWVMSIIVVVMRSSSGDRGAGSESSMLRNTSMLQCLRLLRLMKMARIIRVFRTFPEIMVLVRAMVASVRTVCITLVFLFIADYVFAVAIMQVSRGTSMEQQYFSSLVASMHTLLILGAFPDQEKLLRLSAEEHWLYWLILFLFILFSTITIMNMMVGVLVEVVKNTQAIEKESLEVRLLRDHLLAAVHSLHGADVSDPSEVVLSKDDFCDLVEHPAAIRVLQNTGVDVIGLVDLVDHIFQDDALQPFTSIMDTVLQLRSSNTATVKDLVELRKYLTRKLGGLK